ncbi:MAG: signal peptidase II, partial [Gemmatimonadales bacterium]
MTVGLLAAIATWNGSLLLRVWARAYLEYAENASQVSAPPWAWINIAVSHFVAAILMAVGLLFLLYWRGPRPGGTALLGLGLFVGGAASNTTERILFGAVTDYIPIPGLESALANPADFAIFVGYVLI